MNDIYNILGNMQFMNKKNVLESTVELDMVKNMRKLLRTKTKIHIVHNVIVSQEILISDFKIQSSQLKEKLFRRFENAKKKIKHCIPMTKSSSKCHCKKAPNRRKKNIELYPLFMQNLQTGSSRRPIDQLRRQKRTQTKCLFRSNQVLNNRKSQPSCTFTIERPFHMYFPTWQALQRPIRSPRHATNEEKWVEFDLKRLDAPP